MAVRINGFEIRDAWVEPFPTQELPLIPWVGQIDLTPPPCNKVFEDGCRHIESIDGTRWVPTSAAPMVNVIPNLNKPFVQVGETLCISILTGGASVTAIDNAGNTYCFDSPKVLCVKIKPIYDTFVLVYRACVGSLDPLFGSSNEGYIDRLEIPVMPPQDINHEVKWTYKVVINGCNWVEAQYLQSLLGQHVNIESDRDSFLGIVTAVELKHIAPDVNPYKFPADIFRGYLKVSVTGIGYAEPISVVRR